MQSRSVWSGKVLWQHRCTCLVLNERPVPGMYTLHPNQQQLWNQRHSNKLCTTGRPSLHLDNDFGSKTCSCASAREHLAARVEPAAREPAASRDPTETRGQRTHNFAGEDSAESVDLVALEHCCDNASAYYETSARISCEQRSKSKRGYSCTQASWKQASSCRRGTG